MTSNGSASSPSELALAIQGFAEFFSNGPVPINVTNAVFDDHEIESLVFTANLPGMDLNIQRITTGVCLVEGVVVGWTMTDYRYGEMFAIVAGEDEESLQKMLTLLLIELMQ